jgi:hypothetical protein
MIVELRSPAQAKVFMERLWAKLKPALDVGKEFTVEVRPLTRTLDQNAKFHAMIGDVAKQMAEAGSSWTLEDWKRLLIDQWAADTNRRIGSVVPSLDGHRVVQLGLQSAKFSVEDAGEFIEWLDAWAAQKGIEWR